MNVELTIRDGIVVNVPDSLELITPYVLREQLDWFEDEIKFIRSLLKTGDHVVDIGANYGVYALSMAKVVGPQGHVWAFEPASSTAAHLAQSIDRNDFSQITLIKAALSNHQGTARLGLCKNSELNSLLGDTDPQQETETVKLMTLDHASEQFSWRGITFVKLDAEGEEGRILEGGARFLSEESPLIMYELKHDDVINRPLIGQFEQVGYRPYRLVPGLNLLAPFSPDEAVDAFQLNLFGCKEDRAGLLAAAGKLARLNGAGTTAPIPLGWREYISQFPYAKPFLVGWEYALQHAPLPGWDRYAVSLGYYHAAQASSSPEDRYLALEQAFLILRELCSQNPELPRLISLSRVAWEFGQRSLAIKALREALSAFRPGATLRLGEPFLAASTYHQTLDPTGKVTDWLFASLGEQLIKLHAFSSYYSGQDTLTNLLSLYATGFQSAEIDRRIGLIKARYSLP